MITLVLDPIRDLGLSGTQVSLAAGCAFAIFYATLGLPIARLADQFNRKRIILAGLMVWSVMAALTGFTKGFWQLLLVRMGVGAGEATLSPSVFSMFSDYFPRHKLGGAISVYSLGTYLGMALAMFAGGAIATRRQSRDFRYLPGAPRLTGDSEIRLDQGPSLAPPTGRSGGAVAEEVKSCLLGPPARRRGLRCWCGQVPAR